MYWRIFTMTENKTVLAWLEEMKAMCQPDNVVWIDGSEEQLEALRAEAVETGEMIKLNQEKLPGCYYHRTAENDVARVEDRTFICTPTEEEAGPINNWMAPDEMYAKLKKLYTGSMKGRTMYVIPYSMGPIGSPFSKIGIELSDSIYVVLNMAIMTRIGQKVLDQLGNDENAEFIKCLHAKKDVNPDDRYIVQFPQDNTIWSINSAYGGNVLLGKKCFALRIASYLGKNQGWMAEHMLILGLENPQGEVKYICAAFPSACGKTNLAMLIPPEYLKNQGYKVWTVGDDISWLNIGPDGRLYAINPEAGFFGVAPGTSVKTNFNALESTKKNTIFTNVALNNADNTVWWEGLDKNPPVDATEWKGSKVNGPEYSAAGNNLAHPNSRFTAPAINCPCISSEFENPQGVPVEAIVFGGYNMATYWGHWLEMGKKLGDKAPKIFHVNWFRKDDEGHFMWPGFGDNMRVLLWILNRCAGKVDAVESEIGYLPKPEDIDLTGLEDENVDIKGLLTIDKQVWLEDVANIEEYFAQFGDKLPKEMADELAKLKANLSK